MIPKWEAEKAYARMGLSLRDQIPLRLRFQRARILVAQSGEP